MKTAFSLISTSTTSQWKLITLRISEHIPDPATTTCSAGRPPLLVCKLLAGGSNSTSDLLRQVLQLVLAVDGDQTGVVSAAGAVLGRSVTAQIQLTVFIHDKEIFLSAVNGPLQTGERCCCRRSDNCSSSYFKNSVASSCNEQFTACDRLRFPRHIANMYYTRTDMDLFITCSYIVPALSVSVHSSSSSSSSSFYSFSNSETIVQYKTRMVAEQDTPDSDKHLYGGLALVHKTSYTMYVCV